MIKKIQDESEKPVSHSNKVLIGNWYEDRYGMFAFQQDDNKDSIFQRNYGERVLPTPDYRILWKTRMKALVRFVYNGFIWSYS